ncbi:glycogen debranching enzyme-like isoform X1 [Brachyistius frenatus]|uniref:glycogen debranching enzyme-like isoform X1 n=1 Tax=Brachyistius frenatus TaxID=100188 RepID=UPI0037E750C2
MVQDPRYRRFGNTVDMSGALDLLLPPSLNQSDVPDCCDAFRRRLEELNFDLYREMNQHAAQAIDCIVGNVVYERVAAEGPQLGKVTRKHPLCPRYFLFPFEEMSVEEEEQLMEQRQKACLLLACDGWVKGDDVIRNFAESGSDVYLRRELMCLEDTIKLRYGEKPEDCPYLWSHMTTYTEMTARLFSGVQLVRCLSTPLHVTQAMLAAARAVRSNLYVAADLSTADQVMESVYVNRLGISSLVRGAAAADSAGLCREPVGAFIQPSLRPLIPATPHTMFMDSPDSHSNMESSVLDILPTSVLVSMSCGATCSSRGHDEMLHQRSEVREDPQYSFWDRVGLQTGMLAVKLVLNRLHQQMAAEGFTQVCVEQLEGGVVTVTRCCPSSQQSVVAVLWRDIKTPEKHHPPDAASIFLPGRVEEVLLEAQTFVRRNNMTDDRDMNDPADWTVEVKEHIQLEDSRAVKRAGVVSGPGRGGEEVVLERFTPGSAIIFRVGLDPLSRQQLGSLRRHLIQFGPQYQNGSLAEPGPPSVLSRPLMTIMERLTLADLNILLYRCDAEEREEGGGCYHIPSGAPLSYGGLQGLMSVLAEIRPQNDLGHPFCENLRHGDWMMDYVSNRLLSRGGAVGEVGLWFQAMFVYLKNLPHYLLPCYFDAIIQGAFRTALTAVFNHMSRFVQDGSSLVKQLSLGSVQMCGVSPSWTPPPLSPHLKDGTHPLSDVTNQEDHRCVSLAAGLPHFCAGTFRCWGRDTFMSVRGLLLLTGRHLEARNVLLSFAGTLRYGLIANLLGLSGSARYNSRDAVWWWLQCVQEFCSLVPDGISILRCPVSRIYPTNESQPQPAGAWNQPLCDVIQEVMQRHLQGIRFRETGETDAGQSDRNITDEGYNVEAGVDQTTGFIYGGNRSNCGTWMDKMGESERAHNKGIPATPRDGSAVELVGLCKSAVRWLVELHSNGNFPYVSVSIHRGGQTYSVSYVEWNHKIQENFERKFYISLDPQNPEEDRPELVHKRGIYKDSVGASSPWCDYQLRPNFPIAMTVAPELFSVEKAWEALTVAEKKLLGPLGMKTLDPDDLVYCGVYNNNLDNDNFHQARGFNYHQGPEWLWPVGYFLRAKLYFAKKLGKEMYERTVKVVKNILSRHAVHLERSPWKGLPELTNEDGRPCSFSCDSHASSMAAILEVLYDLSSAAQRTRV